MASSAMVPCLIESMKLPNSKILVGPASCLGGSVEPTLLAGMWVSYPQECEPGKADPITSLSHGSMSKGEMPPLTLQQMRELTLPLPSCSTQEGWPCTSPGQHNKIDCIDGVQMSPVLKHDHGSSNPRPHHSSARWWLR